MATELTVNTTNRTPDSLLSGLLTAIDATGNYWTNTGREMIIIYGGSGATTTVTFDVQATADIATVTDPTNTVAAGAHRIFGPFPVSFYNDTNGRCNISFSGGTAVTVFVFRPTTS